jgi:hypothetical protein
MAFKQRSEWLSAEEQQAEVERILGVNVASFDSIFKPQGGGSSKFLKVSEDKETFLVQQTGDPIETDQKNDKGEVTWLVKMVSAPKYKPMGEGTFDPKSKEVENAFKPDPNYHFPVRIIGHKSPKGETLEDFDGAEIKWDTSAGDTFSKLRDALMDAETDPEVGTIYAVKRLDSTSKPYTWSVKVVKTADQVADEK